jgi:uncharacterized protein
LNGRIDRVEISFDPPKRQWTLDHRGLDFEDAVEVFAGPTIQIEDEREDYGEPRFQAIGLLRDRLVMIVWTPRSGTRHVISMRKCNDREKYGRQLGS